MKPHLPEPNSTKRLPKRGRWRLAISSIMLSSSARLDRLSPPSLHHKSLSLLRGGDGVELGGDEGEGGEAEDGKESPELHRQRQRLTPEASNVCSTLALFSPSAQLICHIGPKVGPSPRPQRGKVPKKLNDGSAKLEGPRPLPRMKMSAQYARYASSPGGGGAGRKKGATAHDGGGFAKVGGDMSRAVPRQSAPGLNSGSPISGRSPYEASQSHSPLLSAPPPHWQLGVALAINLGTSPRATYQLGPEPGVQGALDWQRLMDGADEVGVGCPHRLTPPIKDLHPPERPSSTPSSAVPRPPPPLLPSQASHERGLAQ